MHDTMAGQVPEALKEYVESLDYWDGGATLKLTRPGIDFAGQAAGAESLARMVIDQPGWQGTRTEQDVAREIKAHCLGWRWIPPLRSRANPVDLEFFQPWPRNLLVSIHLLGARPRG